MASSFQTWLFGIVLGTAVLGAVILGVFCYKDTQLIVDRIYSHQVEATKKLLENAPPSDELAAISIYATLELDTLTARNNRAASHLATRTWLRFLTTMFGAILIILGSAFVLGRVTVDLSRLEIAGKRLSAAFATTSPGLILAVLGAGLMIWPLTAQQDIVTNDGASYGHFIISGGESAAGADVIVHPLRQQGTRQLIPPPDDVIRTRLRAILNDR